jgi:hypothetical protein
MDVATGGAGGVGGHILLVGFERVSHSVFLPPFHRAPETERFRSSFDDVRPIRDPVQQRFAESWVRKHGRPLGKRQVGSYNDRRPFRPIRNHLE